MNEEDILRINVDLLFRITFILEIVFRFENPGTILLILVIKICLWESYPEQRKRKCSFSIYPDLQTEQYLSDIGMFLCLPLSIINKWALVRILEIAALSEILTKLSTYKGLFPIL